MQSIVMTPVHEIQLTLSVVNNGYYYMDNIDLTVWVVH